MKALPQDKKDALKANLNEKLDKLEDKANEKGNDTAIITIAAIRAIIAQI